MAGGAALHGARRLRAKVLEVAAQLLDLGPAELDIAGGQLVGPGVPRGRLSISELVRRIDLASGSGGLPPGTDTDLTVTQDFDGGESGWSGGTHCCLVEVDPMTGLVRILRYLVVEDCGVLINPAIVDGQIRGGVAQGVGAVLLERSAYDPQGQYLSASLMDYLLPTTLDVPNIEIEHLTPVRLDPDVNFRGVGEGGMIAAPPAICNAIADAISPFGAVVGRCHLPPARILELIGAISA
jgi:carbon-monoxide dehydrogenase large subunit